MEEKLYGFWQTVLMTSQFLIRGHKMHNFLVVCFLRIPETLKAHIYGMEQILTSCKKPSFGF